ncbi:MAG TPA: tetratricopeptide repeat protein, partial [Flavisolibacter sp.]|nr:tetratricopeptide repeat protein [Flavisolibacter sp.]
LYLAKKGNTAEALRQYDLAIRSNYNFLDAYLDKGELLFNQKRYDEAAANFRTALRVKPATALFYFWMGKIDEVRGDKAEAKLNYQKAYGLDKEMEEAKKAADRL